MSRAVRILHFAMLTGVLVTAAVFVFLVRVPAAAAVVAIAALAVFRPSHLEGAA